MRVVNVERDQWRPFTFGRRRQLRSTDLARRAALTGRLGRVDLPDPNEVALIANPLVGEGIRLLELEERVQCVSGNRCFGLGLGRRQGDPELFTAIIRDGAARGRTYSRGRGREGSTVRRGPAAGRRLWRACRRASPAAGIRARRASSAQAGRRDIVEANNTITAPLGRDKGSQRARAVAARSDVHGAAAPRAAPAAIALWPRQRCNCRWPSRSPFSLDVSLGRVRKELDEH